MKKLIVILIVFAVIIAVLFALKDVIARTAVTGIFERITGAPMEIGNFSFSLARSQVEARQVRIMNPPGFTPDAGGVMAEIPLFFLDLDLGEYLRGKIHVRELRLDLQRLVIERNRAGQLNVARLGELRPKGGEGPAPETRIDVAQFSVGKVEYIDYVLGSPLRQEYDVNVSDRLTDVTDPYALGAAILVRALRGTPLSDLAGLDLNALSREFDRSLRQKAGETLEKFRRRLGNFTFPQ